MSCTMPLSDFFFNEENLGLNPHLACKILFFDIINGIKDHFYF